MTFATRIARLVALLVVFGPTALTFAQPQGNPDHPREACQSRSGDAIRFYEVRASDRIEEDLALVDGINTNRDVYVIACREKLLARLADYAALHDPGAATSPSRLPYTAVVEVRAWHKPKEGGWREMRLHEPDQQQVEAFVGAGLGPEFWGLQQVLLIVKPDTIVDPGILIPLRRDAVKPEDVIRIRVRTEVVETAALEKRLADIANPPPKQKTESSTPPSRPLTALDNEEIIDSTYQVGRFGLHVVFSDLVVFVQRLGEDSANAQGTNPVLFDSANFRPAPGASYGFTYYNRRNAFLRFLEPGFGAHLVFLNWTDRPRLAPEDTTQVTALQLGVGVMGSMFDGTVVAVLGSNLHVKDHRPYFGVGFSVTGMVRKLSRFLAD